MKKYKSAYKEYQSTDEMPLHYLVWLTLITIIFYWSDKWLTKILKTPEMKKWYE